MNMLDYGDLRCPNCDEHIKEKRKMTAASYVIFVKTINGKTLGVEVEPDDNVLYVKKEMYHRLNIPVESQKFICKGNVLEDNQTLQAQKVEGNDTIQMVMELQIE